jgi:hypothetical protein
MFRELFRDMIVYFYSKISKIQINGYAIMKYPENSSNRIIAVMSGAVQYDTVRRYQMLKHAEISLTRNITYMGD